MGENLYTINGSLLSALNGSIADFDDAVPLDSNTLDPNTEVYTRVRQQRTACCAVSHRHP